jgi:hypothetical protein
MSESVAPGHEPGDVEDARSAGNANGAAVNSDDEQTRTTNPLSSAFDFRLSMPELEVRMVNAATLGDFEVWLYAASLTFSAVVGFLVAYLQSFHKTVAGNTDSSPSLLVMTIVLFLLFIGFSIRAAILRRALRSGTKTYKMRAVGESDG